MECSPSNEMDPIEDVGNIGRKGVFPLVSVLNTMGKSYRGMKILTKT